MRACWGGTLGCSDDGFKLKEGRFILDIREKFYMVRVMRH